MKATQSQLFKILDGSKQFRIPIYQRTYSWTEKQCEQLWDDIIRISENDDIPGHFIGSIVYIERGIYQATDISELLVIDGQQRLTTLSLLLAAFAQAIIEKGNNGITKNKIRNSYLFNSDEEGEKRYKLILTQSDKNTLINILEEKRLPENPSKNIINNYIFFQEKISKNKISLGDLYKGILKLIVVDISLDSNYDNPQLIFESLNSTGLELSQADLIRNFILMGLEQKKQDKIYNDYWYPMEKSFREKNIKHFDRFMRDYLTIKTGQIPKIDEVYSSFKEYFISTNKPDDIVLDVHYYSTFFTKLVFEEEKDIQLNQIIKDINTLKVEVAYPFLLEVYVDYDQGKIDKTSIMKIFSMVESYVFRRAVCDIPTNSLNKTFGNLASEITKEQYVESVEAVFCLKDSYRRFPTDNEFQSQFKRKNMYNTRRIIKHFLDKLENYERKEHVDMDKYTIEHIMPQNKNLSSVWKGDLGEKWMEVQEKYVHTVGNLTLTGYNSEMGDKSFLEKRDMDDGFANSPLRINSEFATIQCWNEEEINKRANILANKSITMWKYPSITPDKLANYSKMEEDDDLDDVESNDSSWNEKLEKSSNEVKQNISTLISMIKEKYECVIEPKNRWLFVYVQRPTERKNLFAVIICGKNTANLVFRINPNSFKDDENTRKVVGWFFSKGTERRISITNELLSQIMSLLEHSFSATQFLIKTRHDAAVKAWVTRNS